MKIETLVPGLLAHEIKDQLRGYLQTTYNFRDDSFAEALEDFLYSNEGIFRGPYIDFKLPFRKPDTKENPGLKVLPDFPPYAHQLSTWQRLTSLDQKNRNTIVSTGTGSGKTECFLYPILDHCLRQNEAGTIGTKAIVFYPMNALAFDQATRLGREIWGNPMLSRAESAAPNVTAGILVGEDYGQQGAKKRHTVKVMTRDSGGRIIDDRQAIISSPPDILLTNYKMLDIMLMNPEFGPFWQRLKLVSGTTLKFLVLDEMHTYDGAQGSDVAFLIRRLKARLGIDEGNLVCIGTSATLSSGPDGPLHLARFGTRLFGEKFTEDSIIGEKRLSIKETFAGISKASKTKIADDQDGMEYESGENLDSYVHRQAKIWFENVPENSVALGNMVVSHPLIRKIFEALEGKPQTEIDVLTSLKEIAISKRQLHSFLSLVSQSRQIVTGRSGSREVPLFFMRWQLWLREVRGLLSSLDNKRPEFHWMQEKLPSSCSPVLTPVFCEECGEHGFLTRLKRQGGMVELADHGEILAAWRDRDQTVRYLFPVGTDEVEPSEGEIIVVCTKCGAKRPSDGAGSYAEHCSVCGGAWRRFLCYVMQSGKSKRDQRQCPACETKRSIRVIGGAANTLASVIANQTFLSQINPPNSKRLLAFADTVQDASHRAGFFNARTYRLNFRTALQTFVASQNEDVPLAEAGQKLIDFWAEKIGEEKTIANLLPGDLAALDEYRKFWEDDRKPLREMLKKRISWEIYLEYGLRAQVGRTLEKTLSSAAFWSNLDWKKKVAAIKERLNNENCGWFADLDEITFQKFLLGLVLRIFRGGGIGLQIFEQYRDKENGFHLSKRSLPWISRMPWGRAVGSDAGRLPSFCAITVHQEFLSLFCPRRKEEPGFKVGF